MGTPAITSRGFDEAAVKEVARLIIKTLTNMQDESVHRQVGEEVKELTGRFPVPGLDF